MCTFQPGAFVFLMISDENVLAAATVQWQHVKAVCFSVRPLLRSIAIYRTADNGLGCQKMIGKKCIVINVRKC